MTYYSDIILAETSLTDYWRLNDTNTTLVNSKSARNGTYVGTYTQSVSGLTGDGDTATTFNGSSGYAFIADNNAFSPAANSGKLSVECWCVTYAADGKTVVGKAGGGSTSPWEWEIQQGYVNPNTYWVVNLLDGGGGGNAQIVTAQLPEFPVGSTMHIVITIDDTADVLKLYLNGTLYGTDTTFSTTTPNGNSPVSIGRRGDNTNYFGGKIDDVAIYNDVLTLSQVQAHYAARLGPQGGTNALFGWF